ncbi:MAG: L,D-transpeptidase [Neomegalonema sp.]|nr:L,D-transpeptidase [Neomegalonema sp.]
MNRKSVLLTRRAAAASMLALLSGCASVPFGDGRLPVAGNLRPQPPRPKAKPPALAWRDHFANVDQGAILVNIEARWLVYWRPGGDSYEAFPIAVPLNPDLTKTGETKIVRRKENPSWRPTPDMRRRMPGLPEFVGPGPDNPLGSRALYLGWTYYAIHGTNNPSSIGTRATSGCFRMHPDDIVWLFDRAAIGTPVKVIESLPGA